MKPRLLSSLMLFALFAAAGCDKAMGGDGEPCRSSGALGPYECDAGLVCNEGRAEPTCEKRNTNRLGDPCSASQNCVADLWCDKKACAKLLVEGQACPAGVGCGPGLECVKSGPTPITCQKQP